MKIKINAAKTATPAAVAPPKPTRQPLPDAPGKFRVWSWNGRYIQGDDLGLEDDADAACRRLAVIHGVCKRIALRTIEEIGDTEYNLDTFSPRGSFIVEDAHGRPCGMLQKIVDGSAQAIRT